MQRLLVFFIFVFFVSCKTTTVYISRHAERAGMMSNDPPLTAEGEKQAQDLRNYLQGKKMEAVYSTNFIRTKATAQPVSDLFGLPVMVYNAQQSAALADSLKSAAGRNVLIIGHSNTVDDLVNRLTGQNTLSDLPDTEYGNLFILKRKGNQYRFERIQVPQTTPR